MKIKIEKSTGNTTFVDEDKNYFNDDVLVMDYVQVDDEYKAEIKVYNNTDKSKGFVSEFLRLYTIRDFENTINTKAKIIWEV